MSELDDGPEELGREQSRELFDAQNQLLFKALIIGLVCISSSIAGYFFASAGGLIFPIAVAPHCITMCLAFFLRTNLSGIVLLSCSVIYTVWGAIVLRRYFVLQHEQFSEMIVFFGVFMASPVLIIMWTFASVNDSRSKRMQDSRVTLGHPDWPKS